MTLIRQDESTILNSSVAVSVDSTTTELKGVVKYASQLLIADTTPAAFTFVDADITVAGFVFVDGDVTVATDSIEETTHDMFTGLAVTLTTSGVLPAGLATSTTYYVIRVDADNFKLASSLVNATAGTAVDITAAAGGGNHTITAMEDSIEEVGHGMTTGLKTQLTTSGTLPAGLALTTDYFVIVLDDDNFRLASSAANAVAGTQVDITAAAGGGTHTFTKIALDIDVEIQGSLDGTTFTLITGTNNTFTASGSILEEVVDPAHKYVKTVYTVTAGQATLTEKMLTWASQ